jgi:hypothetical protein
MKYKVQGHDRLIKDDFNSAIINTDTASYRKYMQSIRTRQKINDEIRDVVREINTLKAEMYEIKEMLKGIVNGS